MHRDRAARICKHPDMTSPDRSLVRSSARPPCAGRLDYYQGHFAGVYLHTDPLSHPAILGSKWRPHGNRKILAFTKPACVETRIARLLREERYRFFEIRAIRSRGVGGSFRLIKYGVREFFISKQYGTRCPFDHRIEHLSGLNASSEFLHRLCFSLLSIGLLARKILNARVLHILRNHAKPLQMSGTYERKPEIQSLSCQTVTR